MAARAKNARAAPARSSAVVTGNPQKMGRRTQAKTQPLADVQDEVEDVEPVEEVEQVEEIEEEDSSRRRSGRTRKPPQRLVQEIPVRPTAAGRSSGARGLDSQDEVREEDDEEEEDEEDEEDGFEDDHEVSASKRRKTNAGSSKQLAGSKKQKQSSSKAAPRPQATRQAQTNDETPGQNTAAGAGRRQTAAAAAKIARTGYRTAVEAQIPDDNAIFNALLSPDLALDGFVENWVYSYNQTGIGKDGEQEEKVYLSELVTLFFRCCGLPTEITPDQADDLDGITDALDDVHNELAQKDEMAIYPLVSKDKKFKNFGRQLTDLISSFVGHLSSADLLFVTPDGPPPSKGPSTPLVHVLVSWLNAMATSQYRAIRHTATVLELKLCTAICDIARNMHLESRKAGEKLKKEEKQGKKGRVIDNLKKQLADFENKKTILQDHLTDIFNALFVHRYRDRDPLIRADCVRELGVWMSVFPEEFVRTAYLHYIDWSLTDADSTVRLEAIKAVHPLLKNVSNLRQMGVFSARALPRIAEMAIQDVEIRIRIQAVQVLGAFEDSGQLEEVAPEKRKDVACLIFDKEPRIRKAVAELIKSFLEERNAELDEEAKGRPAGSKQIDEEDAFIACKCIAETLMTLSARLDGRTDSSADGPIPGSSTPIDESRAKTAVDALVDKIDVLGDWASILSFVSRDHDGHVWAMDEEEQRFMLQVADAVLAHALNEEDQDVASQMTRSIIDALPKLLSQYQSEPTRLSAALQLLRHCRFGALSEIGLERAFDTTWEQMTRLILRQSDPHVLRISVSIVQNLLSGPLGQRDTAQDKLSMFKDDLAGNLRDVLADKEIETSGFDGDESNLESALLRLENTFPLMDLRAVFDAKDEGRSSLWEAALALAGRARLGYAEEIKLIQSAIHILVWYLTWAAVAVGKGELSTDDCRERRDEAISLLQDLALGSSGTTSNVAEVLRRDCLDKFLRLHLIFSTHSSSSETVRQIAMTLEESVQFRLAGAVQAAIQKQVEAAREIQNQVADLGNQKEFYQLIFGLVTAIKSGIMEPAHASVMLNHFGQLDSTFDAAAVAVVDTLASDAVLADDAEMVVQIAGKAMQEVFENALSADKLANFTAFITVLRPIFFVYKAGFKVEHRIASGATADLHEAAIDWVVRKLSAGLTADKSSKQSKQRTRAAIKHVEFFRGLSALAPGLRPREALAVKTHLTESLSQSYIDPSQNKALEPLGAYERKLVSLAATDKKIHNAAADHRAEEHVAEGQGETLERRDQITSPARELDSLELPILRDEDLALPDMHVTLDVEGDNGPHSREGSVVSYSQMRPKKKVRRD